MLTRKAVLAALLCLVALTVYQARPADMDMTKMANDLASTGVSQYQAGDMTAALDSFNKAIAMQKDCLMAIYGKAAIQFIQGKYQDSANSLEAYLGDTHSDTFAWMWSYVAQARGGSSDKGSLSQMQAMTDEGTWFYTVLGLFLGTSTPENLMSVVKDTEKPRLDAARLRAQFFIGESYLLAGDKAKAKDAFQACVDMAGPFQWERELAKAEIKQIGAVPAPPAPAAK
jgi:lipoprotein NlpI